MREFLKKLGFHSPDEMERAILFQSQRNAYLFLAAALLIWSLYESCRVYVCRSRLNPLPCLLLAAAAVIQAFSQLILTRNAVKDDVDSFETGPIVKLIVLVCVVASAIAAVIAAVLLTGVKV